MSRKQQALSLGEMKCLWQIRAGRIDSALTINPYGALKLVGSEKIVESRQAAGMGKIVGRAGDDANLGITHVVLSFGCPVQAGYFYIDV